MATPLTTRAALVSRAGGESDLLNYAKGDEAFITRSIAVASERVTSALKNTFDADAVDALDAATAPEEVQFHVENLALDFLTMWDGARPDAINKAADTSNQWLKFAAGGSVNLNLDRTDLGSARGRGGVSWQAPEVDEEPVF